MGEEYVNMREKYNYQPPHMIDVHCNILIFVLAHRMFLTYANIHISSRKYPSNETKNSDNSISSVDSASDDN